MVAADDAAGNLLTGITGGLCGEIIPIAMDYDRTVEDIPDPEALVIKSAPGIALIAEKREQVTGMLRMGGGIGIVMVAGSGKIFRAIPIFMNMKCIEAGASGNRNSREIEDFGFDQDSAVGGLIEFHQSADLRIS